jgi:choline dehydrogenase
MVWYRGQKADYDAWAEAGNVGWDYQSVLPHFKASESWEDGGNDYRGGSGPIRVERAKQLHPVAGGLIEAARSHGLAYLDDINISAAEGTGALNMNVHKGRRSSPWSAYLEPVIDNPRLTLLANANVGRLFLESGRCVGIDIHSQKAVLKARATRDVILCAGAIDTPRLLLLSGIGNADELRANDISVVHDLPGVGKNLQDHIILGGLCFTASQPMFPFNNNLEGSCVICRSDLSIEIPDLTFVAMQIPFATPEIAEEFPVAGNAFCLLPGLMSVASRGELKLNGSGLGIQANMLREEADLKALVSAIDIGLELADQPGLRNLISSWAAPTSSLSRSGKIEFVRHSASSYAHPVGTCAMGNGREHAVDFNLRVHGLTGLRVADASVMPTIPKGNTHAATIMIAEVAASKIADADFRY